MNQHLPSITPILATQLEAAITFFSLEKQKALSFLSGNPYGIHLRSFGQATAFLAQRTQQSSLLNRVHGMSDIDLPYLDALLDWYQSYGVSCCFDIIPLHKSSLLLWHLATKGFYQSGFYNVFYGLPTIEAEVFSPITIRPVLPEEQDLFADVYIESFEVPKTATYDYVRESIRVLVEIPTNRCFFALVEQKVTAIAVLSLHPPIAYLALAATLPAFRGYGCHHALLRARIKQAAQHGCTLVTAQAGVGTTSQRNMERVGLHLAYTKADWTLYDKQQPPNHRLDPTNR